MSAPSFGRLFQAHAWSFGLQHMISCRVHPHSSCMQYPHRICFSQHDVPHSKPLCWPVKRPASLLPHPRSPRSRHKARDPVTGAQPRKMTVIRHGEALNHQHLPRKDRVIAETPFCLPQAIGMHQERKICVHKAIIKRYNQAARTHSYKTRGCCNAIVRLECFQDQEWTPEAEDAPSKTCMSTRRDREENAPQIICV